MKLCPTTLARWLPRWLAVELGAFFFRTLDHAWSETEFYGNGGQQQCAKCKTWRYYNSRKYVGKTPVVEWRAGKHPAWRLPTWKRFSA